MATVRKVVESWEELRNADLPEGTLCTVTINIRHGAAFLFKRGTWNLTCHGLLRLVTAGSDGRQDTSDGLAKQSADSVEGVGNGVGCCSLTKSYSGSLSTSC